MAAFFNSFEFTCILRILLSVACGAVIGFERTKRSKEAGVRTHCILCCASAAFMLLSKYAFSDISVNGTYPFGSKEADAARLAAGVISGIGFLGTGVIFRNGNTVKGLTTAAGIWATGAVGLACGAGMYVIAVCLTIVIVLIQFLLHRFSIGSDAFSNSEIHITFVDSPEIRQVLKEKCEEYGIHVVSSKITNGVDGLKDMVLFVRQRTEVPFQEMLAFMDSHPEIKHLRM